MIDGADWLCREHFGKGLIDEGVDILDPATGTGTFVCELLESFSGQPQKLYRKYKEEIHANEVAILPYYVANLNIEATYYSIAQQYAEYENLCFVDTLDNVEGLGKFSGHQEDLFGAVTEENIARIKRQNKRKISVVIGNPPYNANQQNENDNNKNRTYDRIDARIKATYIAESTAQKTKAYDMYTRFFRWASDRIDKEGIVAFVTNRSFIEARTMDGFRKRLAAEFNQIWVTDLRGDARTSGERRRKEGGNVFNDKIRVGVAIYFCVRNPKQKGTRVLYEAVREYAKADEKLAFLAKPLAERQFEQIRPDADGNWLGQTSNDFGDFIPAASKDTKAAYSTGQERATFKMFSLGVVTNRDDWVYDRSALKLSKKVQYLVFEWNKVVKERSADATDIKMTRQLKGAVRNSKPRQFEKDRLIPALYRPFTKEFLYYCDFFNEMRYQTPTFFGDIGGYPNRTINMNTGGDFRVVSADCLTDLHFIGDNALLPRYRYTSSGERIDNITDWALGEFRAHYGAKVAIEKDSIFHYAYAVLHDPLYREKYALNLKREFPRIPFYPDFPRWVAWGEKLMALHIGFESVDPWPLQRVGKIDEKARAAKLKPKPVLKSDHETGVIVLDSETQLTGIPPAAWDYRLGNRTALDWILDQHKEKTPKDPTIREKFNTYRFADYKEKVVDLLGRVTRVSVETVAITEAMKGAKR